MKKVFIITVCLFLPLSTILAQQDTIDYYSLSLEELMNIQIVSASKKSESLFDAALSASVLTHEEIKNAGITSIPEALRLIPGVIVREQTNGNYDIHIRGLDNVPPNSLILSSINTTTLVMINNRPVYNYMQGGTFWESLPIDLNDVDKIEVVRGPSSTLYGPNAVSGVINIITRKVEKDGLSVNGTAQLGSQNTSIANTSVEYKFNSKFDIGLSGNMQLRGRDTWFFDENTGTWVNSTAELSFGNTETFYAHPDQSLRKYGVNAFANYNASGQARFSLMAGLQDSYALVTHFDTSPTNITASSTESKYVDLHASTYGFTTQVSYTTARQDPSVGMSGSTYDYQVTDASIEYEVNAAGISIKPGFTYRSAAYDDSRYWDVANGEGVLGGKRTIETLGGSVRFDTKLLNDKLRLTGGIRMDKFTHPDKWFTSYQAAASYKLNERNLFRVVYSKAYRSPFMFDTFLHYESRTPLDPNGMYALTEVTGNRDMMLLSSRMLEAGYRIKPAENISIDVEGYYTYTSDYNALVQHATVPTPQNFPEVAYTLLSLENIPLEVSQIGATVSFTAVVGKLLLKPFITLQRTTLKDYSPYFNTADAAPSPRNGNDPAANNLNSGIGSEQDHKFTPGAYGGAYLNYAVNSKLNVNLSTYWFSKQTFYEQSNIIVNDGVTGVADINGKALVNVKLSYKPVPALAVFVSGRNLLGQESVEYYRSDAIQRMFLGGVSFDF